jgi:hypothetical protein
MSYAVSVYGFCQLLKAGCFHQNVTLLSQNDPLGLDVLCHDNVRISFY